MERIRYYERTYDKDGIYKGYELARPVLSVDKTEVKVGKPIYHNASPNMEVKPAVREHSVKQLLLTNRNLLANPSFEQPGFPLTGGKPPGWAGTARTNRKLIDIGTGAIGCLIVSGSTPTITDSEYIEATKFTVETSETASVKLVFSFEYFIQRGRGWQKPQTVEIHSYVQVGKYFLTTDGLWVEGFQTIIISDIESHGKLEKFEIETQPLPEGGEVTVRLHAIVSPGTTNTNVAYPIYDNVNLSILIDDELPKKEYPLHRLIEPRNTIVPSVNEVFLADAPELPNAKILYRNVLYRQDGNLTAKWKRRGIEEHLSLLEIILDCFVWTDSIPVHKLSVSLFSHWTPGSNSVSFSSIIRDPYNRGRHFLITSGTFDDKYGEWKLMLTEVRTTLDTILTDPDQPEEPEQCPERLLEDGSFRLLDNGEIRLLECLPYFGDVGTEDGEQRVMEDGSLRVQEYYSLT